MKNYSNITFISPARKYLSDDKPLPPLGLGYLAAILKQDGYRIRFIDGLIQKWEKYNHEIETIKDEIICISTLVIHLKEVKRICEIIKEKDPTKKIIIGGPGLKIIPYNELFDFFNADFFVLAEAEFILPLLLKNIDNTFQLKKIKGIVYKEKESVKYTGQSPPISNIDEIPLPDRDLLNVLKYLKIWKDNTGLSCTDMISSRGCPFSCAFCDKAYAGSKIRYHSVEYVLNEMQEIMEKHKPDDLYIVDDLFLFDHKRTKKICEGVKERNIEMSWGGHARVDTLNRDILSTIRDAGCNELNFGIETGNPTILKQLGKKFTYDQVEKAFKLCHEFDIDPGAYFMVGIPGTTRDDLEKTKKLISRIKPAMIILSYLTPYPGTKMYEDMKQYIDSNDYSQWDDFNRTILNYKFEIDPYEEYQEIMDFYINEVATTTKIKPWFKETIINQRGGQLYDTQYRNGELI
jgi:radical SAM superfamily enzyme YgiQ (UPF0313 family)